MIDKTKTILTWVLIIMVVVAIGYSAIRLVINMFEEPDLITPEEIVLYKVDSNLVKDYSTYYYVESCFNNFLEGCKLQKYDELYELYLKDYKKQYEKEEVFEMFKSYANKENVDFRKVYKAEEIYILEVYINNDEHHLLLSTNNLSKLAYEFAIIK